MGNGLRRFAQICVAGLPFDSMAGLIKGIADRWLAISLLKRDSGVCRRQTPESQVGRLFRRRSRL